MFDGYECCSAAQLSSGALSRIRGLPQVHFGSFSRQDCPYFV